MYSKNLRRKRIPKRCPSVGKKTLELMKQIQDKKPDFKVLDFMGDGNLQAFYRCHGIDCNTYYGKANTAGHDADILIQDYDIVVLNNILNKIPDKEERKDTLATAMQLSEMKCLIIHVYEARYTGYTRTGDYRSSRSPLSIEMELQSFRYKTRKEGRMIIVKPMI